MKVLVLDNYDSFTWNLVQGIEAAGGQCAVHRSDQISVEEIRNMAPERIVLSPGPFGPDRTGVCREALREFAGRIPILGVCLGMQVIASEAGASIAPSGEPMHGKASLVWHDGSHLFDGIPNPFPAARYHSLIVEPASVPASLQVSAWAQDGAVLGCRAQPGVEGVLFHPESFLTTHGPRLLANFVRG